MCYRTGKLLFAGASVHLSARKVAAMKGLRSDGHSVQAGLAQSRRSPSHCEADRPVIIRCFR